jgi:hypothetical protein
VSSDPLVGEGPLWEAIASLSSPNRVESPLGTLDFGRGRLTAGHRIYRAESELGSLFHAPNTETTNGTRVLDVREWGPTMRRGGLR